MISDFVADCRRIEEWGKEQFEATRKFMAERAGQKLGAEFTLEDLPRVAIELPSRRKALCHSAGQGQKTVENQLTPQA